MLAFSIWNAIWIVFLSFVFINVLVMMFSVIVDIFRDRSLSGWAKAGWLFFLATFTLATLLVYVIVRGRGMTERSLAEQAAAKESFDAYVRETAGGGVATELEKAANLHTAGELTDDEYATLKSKILA